MKQKLKSLAWVALYMLIAVGSQLVLGIALGIIIFKIAAVTGIAGNAEGLQKLIEQASEFISRGLPLIVLSGAVELVLLGCFGPWYYFREKRYGFRPCYRKSFSVKNVLRIVGIGFFGQYLISLIIALVYMVLPEIFKSYETLVENFDISNGPPLLMIFFVCLLGPLAEEVVFRGMIYGRLRRAFSLVPSMLISALLFGIYHGNWVQGIYASVFGMILAYVYEKTQTIWGSFLLHAVFNLSSYIIGHMEGAMENVGWDIPTWAVFLFYVISAVIVALLLRQFRTEPGEQNVEKNGE